MANLSRPPPPQSPKTEERFGRKPAVVCFCCSCVSAQSNIHVKQNHKPQLQFREKSCPCPRLRMQMKTFGSSTKCQKIRCQTLLLSALHLSFVGTSVYCVYLFIKCRNITFIQLLLLLHAFLEAVGSYRTNTPGCGSLG